MEWKDREQGLLLPPRSPPELLQALFSGQLSFGMSTQKNFHQMRMRPLVHDGQESGGVRETRKSGKTASFSFGSIYVVLIYTVQSFNVNTDNVMGLTHIDQTFKSFQQTILR